VQPIKLDGVFAADTQSAAAMANDCRRVSESLAEGYNGALVFFGPMGAGKSHAFNEMLSHILQHSLNACAAKSATHEVHVVIQAVEISADGLHDLLAGPTSTAISVRKDSFDAVVFDGATSQPLPNLLAFRDVALQMANMTQKRRRQRSHIIYVLRATMKHKLNDSALRGKLVLADLAGSGALGDQQDVTNAKYINRSIVSLQHVIQALTTQGQTGVPYLDDLLVTALSDVFGGNSRTVVVTAVDSAQVDESLQALQVAAAARGIKNAPKLQCETAEVAQLRAVAGRQDGSLLVPVLREVLAQRD